MLRTEKEAPWWGINSYLSKNSVHISDFSSIPRIEGTTGRKRKRHKAKEEPDRFRDGQVVMMARIYKLKN